MEEVIPLSVVQDRIDEILVRLAEMPAMSAAAAANPLLVLEELGFALDLEGRLELQDRARFGKREIAERRRLRRSIFEHAGRPFDLHDPDALFQLLSTELRLATPGGPEQMEQPIGNCDPLHGLKDAHPIMAPLLAYRRLDASAPGFAPPELYRKLRSGQLTFPDLRLRARLRA
ncbi:hypothetical protein KXS07_31470 [Inquilinus limosus]|uniref:hypothetical protein n=1 Tax=Inquilinus limosus TaxID=171674 RepID=UPI003F161993